MDNIRILIVIAMVILVIYYNFINDRSKENFQPPPTGYKPGYARRHPDQDNMSPDTYAKLTENVYSDVTRASGAELAFNDSGAYSPSMIRPYNESNFIVSSTEARAGTDLATQFDNSFYQLWISDEAKEKAIVLDRANKIATEKKECINFKNVNQCMSVCAGTDYCSGFYMEAPDKCCMMTDPPYNANRHNYTNLPSNIDKFSKRTINKLIKRAEKTDGKIVFDHIRNDSGNHTFKANLDRKQCKSICPKCVIGRCPPNYRCINLTADPRYNYSCIITNDNRYDENTGLTFDNPNIPYMDEKYGLNEYAGYDLLNTKPVLTLPQDYTIELDDRIVPTEAELDAAFKKFAKDHPGPDTKESFDEWVNRDGYRPELESNNINFVATRGGNDPINLDARDKYVRSD